MKKQLLISLVMIFILSFAGCSAVPELGGMDPTPDLSDTLSSSSSQSSQLKEEGESSAPESSSAGQTIRQTLTSGVVVNATVFLPAKADFSKLATYAGSLQRLDVEKGKEALFGAEVNVRKTEQKTGDSRFPDAKNTVYEAADGSFLSGTEDMLSYSSSPKSEVNAYLWLEPCAEYNGDAFLTGKEFSFGSRQECVDRVREVLNRLGIQVVDEYICYSVDHETLTREAQRYRAEQIEKNRQAGVLSEDGTSMTEEDCLKLFPDPNYTAEDDCYHFKLFASAEGIPITRAENGSAESGTFTPGSIIEAVVSKEGIVDLYVNGVYRTEGAVDQGKGLNLDEAISALNEKYNAIIPDGEYEVREIAFEYVPISQGNGIDVKLIPAWRFLIKHTMEVERKTDGGLFTVTQVETVMLNALTGKEILRDVGSI